MEHKLRRWFESIHFPLIGHSLITLATEYKGRLNDVKIHLIVATSVVNLCKLISEAMG